ncbi:protein ANTAGONIST OF LIKE HETEROCHROMATIN PROTEIN 1-like isoform X2 [Scaptodrosophila lebanonensis]|uniref:Protein ANTAGONIST OF LIKE HETEROCHROMATIN PROTEIN 1-like isoform X2 n=1 Tax=Drosophila lebanonensis TaxID=7225 RepID=A0A6J2TRC6_DROLE|nr:protein ANTAGONIST OF LIKE HETEROCHROMATIN PROTEIN 1-like isoform X2 [Scaptodrosophila lebanonensis]
MKFLNGFTNGISSLPNVVGVIEEFRIPLKLPIRVANTSERQCHALALQVVSDARSRFLDVHIDVPNDLQCILMKSPLFERLIDTDQDQPLMSEQQHLVGEMSYPLLLNLMTPFPDYGDLTPCHMSYNLAVHLWNAPVERAFASLLSRFQRLQSLDITTLDLACVVVSAACMLHNFILDCGEPLEDITVDFEAMPKSQINMVFEENGQQYWEHTLAAEKKRESLVAGFLRSQ